MIIDKNKFLIMCGPNVIESEEHTLLMARQLKSIFNNFPNIQFVFKTSFDKANRTSYNSYRGLGINEGLRILKKVKDELNLNIITDVHEPHQVEQVSKVVDILQVPAFLCRQTDLIEAVAKTDKIIHVKKGQFLNADSMLKVVEKLRKFGHTKEIILCERGTMFGYNDLIVDTRNLVWMKSDENLVSMDITHCLQQPAKKHDDGTVKAGGLRNFIPLMGKIALVSNVDALFMEVHNDPDNAKCDGPTQFPLNKLESLLEEFDFEKTNIYSFNYKSSTINCKCILNTIEKDALGFFGKFEKENVRGEKILNKIMEYDFKTILDIGAGGLTHAKIFYDNNKLVDICDFGESVYFKGSTVDKNIINESFYGNFNTINFGKKYDAIWCCHTLEHQLNPNFFLKKINSLLKDNGILGIVVPIRKPIITDGHVSIWNAGLLIYHLVMANFDTSNCKVLQYDYNIGIILKKKEIELPSNLHMDTGDLEKLSKFLPPGFISDKINGDIMEYNFDKITNDNFIYESSSIKNDMNIIKK